MVSNIAPPIKQVQKTKKLTDFEWIPDPYEFLEETRKQTSKDDRKNDVSDLPFVAAQNNNKQKYEPTFGDNDTRIKHYFDPYDSAKEMQIRENWISKLNYLHGEFKPALKEKNLEKIGRSLLPDIVLQIRKCLTSDWPETKLIVGCIFYGKIKKIANPEDFIEIKFDVKTVDNLLGLHAYMNHILSNDQTLREYNLRKVMQNWGIKECDYAYYMLAPPWVKLDPKEALPTVFPENAKLKTSYTQKYNPLMNSIKLYSKSIDLS